MKLHNVVARRFWAASIPVPRPRRASTTTSVGRRLPGRLSGEVNPRRRGCCPVAIVSSRARIPAVRKADATRRSTHHGRVGRHVDPRVLEHSSHTAVVRGRSSPAATRDATSASGRPSSSGCALAWAPAAGIAREAEAGRGMTPRPSEERDGARNSPARPPPERRGESLAAFTGRWRARPLRDVRRTLFAQGTAIVGRARGGAARGIAQGRRARRAKACRVGESRTARPCNTDPKLDFRRPLRRVRRLPNARVVPPPAGRTLGAVALYSSSLANNDASQRRLLEQAAAALPRPAPPKK